MKTQPNPPVPNPKLAVRYAVGIDPDIKKSGFAVWYRPKSQYTFIGAVSNSQVLDYIDQFAAGEAIFYVDAGWLNGGYFHAIPPTFDTWNPASQKAYLIKRGIDVGRNFGAGQLIVDRLRARGHEVIEVKPEGKQGQKLKWDADTLKRLTGWTERTNEDARDAARLCFQR